MKKTKTYRVISKTNGWIAQRIGWCKTEILISDNLTLKQAKCVLLSMLRNDYEIYFPNWGCVMNSKIGRNYVSHYKDGTYSYEYDSRYCLIEEEETNQ
jgi:hypothetical protein